MKMRLHIREHYWRWGWGGETEDDFEREDDIENDDTEDDFD